VDNLYGLDSLEPFVPATQRVYRTAEHPSRIRVHVLPRTESPNP
jgi:hypothetical protein